MAERAAALDRPSPTAEAELLAAALVGVEREPFHRGALGIFVLRLLLALAVLAAWEFASGRLIEPFWISSPVAIATKIHEWVITGFLFPHLEATLTAMVIGFAVGATSGVLCGLALGGSPLLADVVRPFLVAFYSIPKVALIPLFILWFGIGLTSVVILVALTVFFPVFYNTFSGVRAVDRDLVDTMRIFGASRAQVFTTVILPASRAWIFAGLRIAVRYALTTTIYGELVGGNRGIGFLLEYGASRFDTRSVMAAIVILGACGLLLVAGVSRSELSLARGHATTIR